MILFVDKDTTLFPSSSIRYRGWLYYCSAFRDKENLKRALLSSTEENPNKEKKQLRL